MRDPKEARDVATLEYVVGVFLFITLVLVAVHLTVNGHDGWGAAAGGGAGGALVGAVRAARRHNKIHKENH